MISLRGKRAYLDASVAIYSVEKLDEFPGLKAGFLDLMDARDLVAVTSELTLLETVVGARKRKDIHTEAAYRILLTPSNSMEVRAIDAAVLAHAIDLRLLGLKTGRSISPPGCSNGATSSSRGTGIGRGRA